jgi:alanine dehydrogenase
MRIGVPKEIKKDEHRVGLTPAAVREYVVHGHQVLVETGAGAGITASDEDYIAAGATIAATAEAVFTAAEMIVKVKEPQPIEWAQLRKGQILFTYLHLASDRPQTEGLLASGVSAIAYETVVGSDGSLPLLTPMSEVAGRLSIQAAARSLEKHHGGEGLLLGGVPGVKPARVAIIGGGVVGTEAAKIAVGMGAEVTILDRSLRRLRQIDDMFNGRVRTVYSTGHAVDLEAQQANVLIGAVLVPGASAPKLVTRAILDHMRPGSVLVDVAIDQGGCAETSRPTTHTDPTFVVDGVVHYCVANMPGAVPHTSTHALNNATLPYGLALADQGLGALKTVPGLLEGLNIHDGKLTSKAVADSLGMDFTPYAA